MPKQVDPELLKQILAEANAVEQTFNVFRPVVGGKELTDNDVRRVLPSRTIPPSTGPPGRRARRWAAQVVPHLMALVKLRNEIAHKLGFKNYHVMQLYLSEQSQEQVLKLFDELDALTRGPFQAAKAELDAALGAECGITPAELRPWHYQDPFFQERRRWGEPLDEVYAAGHTPALPRFLRRHRLAGRRRARAQRSVREEGQDARTPSAIDLDRQGDVRVLDEHRAQQQWLSTMLHELGHSVYSSKNIPRQRALCAARSSRTCSPPRAWP